MFLGVGISTLYMVNTVTITNRIVIWIIHYYYQFYYQRFVVTTMLLLLILLLTPHLTPHFHLLNIYYPFMVLLIGSTLPFVATNINLPPPRLDPVVYIIIVVIQGFISLFLSDRTQDDTQTQTYNLRTQTHIKSVAHLTCASTCVNSVCFYSIHNIYSSKNTLL